MQGSLQEKNEHGQEGTEVQRVTGRSHVDGFHVHVSCFMRIKCILIVAFEGVKTENELKRETERERQREIARVTQHFLTLGPSRLRSQWPHRFLGNFSSSFSSVWFTTISHAPKRQLQITITFYMFINKSEI